MFSDGHFPSLNSSCERKVSSHCLLGHFWPFPSPEGITPLILCKKNPGSLLHPGPILLSFLAKENPPNNQLSGVNVFRKNTQQITKEEQFFQEVFPAAVQ